VRHDLNDWRGHLYISYDMEKGQAKTCSLFDKKNRCLDQFQQKGHSELLLVRTFLITRSITRLCVAPP
jgi:hypothetical protein